MENGLSDRPGAAATVHLDWKLVALTSSQDPSRYIKILFLLKIFTIFIANSLPYKGQDTDSWGISVMPPWIFADINHGRSADLSDEINHEQLTKIDKVSMLLCGLTTSAPLPQDD